MGTTTRFGWIIFVGIFAVSAMIVIGTEFGIAIWFLIWCIVKLLEHEKWANKEMFKLND